ncbi:MULTISPECIES: hypothetical protein [Rhodomicrobium]|uniref:hypothetical protein n=1 Tax=Rhodomicrobium TaxID=1068 RepID=UPI000B4AC0B2|nr:MULTISPECIES: hypothetical protein [Rhodomicrobium]
MVQAEPPSQRPTLFVGRNSRGVWVVQDEERQRGGLFFAQSAALRYALAENGQQRHSVVMVSGIFELDFADAPKLAQPRMAENAAPAAPLPLMGTIPMQI